MTSYPSDIEINSIDDGNMRGHSAFSSNSSLKDSFVLLNTLSRPYHKRMEISNKLPEVNSIDSINSFQLSYAITAKVGSSVSLVTNKKAASNSQHVNNPILKKGSKLCGNGKGILIKSVNTTPSEHMSDNVQIPYNVNQAVDPESWNSNFNSILLHSSMEHLVLDIKNIKKSLYHIKK